MIFDATHPGWWLEKNTVGRVETALFNFGAKRLPGDIDIPNLSYFQLKQFKNIYSRGKEGIDAETAGIPTHTVLAPYDPWRSLAAEL